MRINKVVNIAFFLLVVLSFNTVLHADEICQKTVNMGDSIVDAWNGNCESINRKDYYDPYNPKAIPAKFYTFTLDRQADVKITLNLSYNVVIYLLDGATKNGTVLKQVNGKTLESYLPAGTYTLEVTYPFFSSFTLNLAYNDVGNTECVQSLVAGASISDGWVPSCESNNRNIADPYSPYPDLGFRAKYFTFTLAEDSDVNIKVTSEENAYLYILSGHGEFATPLLEFDKNDVLTPLPTGDYTVELTTNDRYSPGNFTILYTVLSNDASCSQELVFDEAIEGNWSNSCLIQTWDNSNSDPYAGVNPERATYYTFSLQETTDFRFYAYSTNPKLVLNLYRGNDYSNLVKTNLKGGYWYGSTDAIIEAALAPDTYTLEVTSYNQVAVGNYSFQAKVLGASVCSQSITVGEYYTGLLSSNCISQYREGVNNDPYGPQPGDYYARRFEFELSEPQAIKIDGSLASSSVFLYLSQKNTSGNTSLLEETEFNYWSYEKSQSMSRVLDSGSYVVELTSAQPFQSSAYSLSVNSVRSSACEVFLKTDELLTSYVSSYSCPSSFKESYQNPDPYGSPSQFVFNSKTITFKVEEAGDITFDISATGFMPHLFLVSGINRDEQPIIEERMSSRSGKITNYLEAGFYTLEITSAETSTYGSFSIKIFDPNLQPPENEPKPDVPPIVETPIEPLSCEYELAKVSEQTITGEWSTDCISEYSVFYKFELIQLEKIEVSLKTEIDASIVVQKFESDKWETVTGSALIDKGFIELSHLFDAGLYRIKLNRESSSSSTNSFELKIRGNLGPDSDNDGVGDDIDLFPQDGTQVGDADKDGIDDIFDNDFDNDGVLNSNDAFPHNPLESEDDDYDGIGNNSDDTPTPEDGVVQLNQLEFMVSESDGAITVLLNRSDYVIGETQGNSFSPPAYVVVRTNDGSAKTNRDFKAISEIVTFESGEASKEIVIEILDNNLFEGNKSFEIELLYPWNMNLGENKKAAVYITDDEKLPEAGRISWKTLEESVEEANNTYSFELLREGNLSGEVIVNYATRDETALASIDYQPKNGSVKFLDGEATKQIQVSLVDNDKPNANKSFSIDLIYTSAGILSINPAKTITILDNDVDPSYSLISFKEDQIKLDEYHGNLGIEVVRTGNLSLLSTLEWRTQAGSAIEDTDFKNTGGILQFAEGEKSKWLFIKLLGDFESDGVKTLSLELFNASQHTAIMSAPLEVTVEDIRLDGRIEFSSDEYRISENVGTYKVAILRPFVRYSNLQVEYVVTAKSAKADSDFIISHEVLNFSGEYDGNSIGGIGDVSQSIQVEILDDDVHEDLEYFEIELTSVKEENYRGEFIVNDDFLGKQTTSRVYIIDNDMPPVSGSLKFSRENYIFPEDQSKATITIQRLNGSKGEVSVDYTTSESTALANQHFNTAAGTLTFADGETAITIEIDIIDNALDENNKSFELTLSNPVGINIVNPLSANIEIQDDDITLLGVISLENTTYDITRSDGMVSIELKRGGGTEGEISVAYRVNIINGNIEQFKNVVGTVVFADGEDTKIIEINLNEEIAGDSEFQVVLSGTGDAQFKGESTVSVKVVDDVEVSEEASKKDKSTLFGSMSLWLLLVTGVFLLLLSPTRKQEV